MIDSMTRVGFRRAAAVAALVLAATPAAESGAIRSSVRYSTTGTVGAGGTPGLTPVGFEGVRGGTLTTDGSPFDLGRFVIAPLPEGASVTYDFAPFDLTFRAEDVDGVATPGEPATFRGWLHGTIAGADASKLGLVYPVLTPPEGSTEPESIASFRAGGLLHYVNIAPDSAWVFRPPAAGGASPLQGVIDSVRLPSPAPEPASALVLACLAAPAVARRVRRGRPTG